MDGARSPNRSRARIPPMPHLVSVAAFQFRPPQGGSDLVHVPAVAEQTLVAAVQRWFNVPAVFVASGARVCVPGGRRRVPLSTIPTAPVWAKSRVSGIGRARRLCLGGRDSNRVIEPIGVDTVLPPGTNAKLDAGCGDRSNGICETSCNWLCITEQMRAPQTETQCVQAVANLFSFF